MPQASGKSPFRELPPNSSCTTPGSCHHTSGSPPVKARPLKCTRVTTPGDAQETPVQLPSQGLPPSTQPANAAAEVPLGSKIGRPANKIASCDGGGRGAGGDGGGGEGSGGDGGGGEGGGGVGGGDEGGGGEGGGGEGGGKGGGETGGDGDGGGCGGSADCIEGGGGEGTTIDGGGGRDGCGGGGWWAATGGKGGGGTKGGLTSGVAGGGPRAGVGGGGGAADNNQYTWVAVSGQQVGCRDSPGPFRGSGVFLKRVVVNKAAW